MKRSLRSILFRNSGNLEPIPDGYSALGMIDGQLTLKNSAGVETPVAGSGSLPAWFDGAGDGYNGSAAFSLDATGTYDESVTAGVLADGSASGAVVGHAAQGYVNGAAVGHSAQGHDYGAAVGHSAQGHDYGAAVGYQAMGMGQGVAVGRDSDGSYHGVAIGRNALGFGYGVAIGYRASTEGIPNRVEIAPLFEGHYGYPKLRLSGHGSNGNWQFSAGVSATPPSAATDKLFGNLDGYLPPSMWTAQIAPGGTALDFYVHVEGVGMKTGSIALTDVE